MRWDGCRKLHIWYIDSCTAPHGSEVVVDVRDEKGAMGFLIAGDLGVVRMREERMRIGIG